jgi:2-methylcitrate dehydratase PrpD
VLNVAGGMSGFAGTLAPELALAGFEAQDGAIEEAFSQLVGDDFQADNMLDEIGQRWEIGRNYFRLRACCNPIYAALDALEAALAELHPTPDEIERIEVATYRFASVMQNPSPANTFAARYSLPHAAAAIVVRGDAGYASFSEAALHDPTIAALRQRVQISEAPQFTAQVPQRKPARVTVMLKDGRQCSKTCESAAGDFQQPYPGAALREKFRQLAALVLSEAGGRAVEAAIGQCEQWSSLRELTDLLRRHGLPASA